MSTPPPTVPSRNPRPWLFLLLGVAVLFAGQRRAIDEETAAPSSPRETLITLASARHDIPFLGLGRELVGNRAEREIHQRELALGERRHDLERH